MASVAASKNSAHKPKVGLKCHVCKNYTQTAEPLKLMKRELQKKVRYELFGVCAVCGGAKSKFLNAAEVRMLPPEALAAPAGTTFDNVVERDGGLLPLLPLLGAIAAGVSALAGVGGTAANVVLNAMKNAEEERHNREIEIIAKEAKGAGLPNETEAAIELLRAKGYTVTAPDDMLPAAIGYLQGKGFVVSI